MEDSSKYGNICSLISELHCGCTSGGKMNRTGPSVLLKEMCEANTIMKRYQQHWNCNTVAFSNFISH